MLTAEQHAIRATGIGSSEIAAICGEDPFQSALDVWLRKTGRVEAKADTVQTRMGNRLEYAIACEFADRHNATIETCTTVRHPQHDWIVASPDRRVVGTRDLLECKNVGYRMRARWSDDGSENYRAPAHVLIQGTWQCLVTGDEAFWVAAWLGGRDYHEERVVFDPDFGAALVEMGGRFWVDCVRGGAQPTPDGSARTRAVLQRLFPKGAGEMPAPPPEAATLSADYARARARESTAKKEKEAAGNQLRAVLGTFDTIDADWGKVTWKLAKKGKPAWAKIAKDAGADPALIAKYTAPPGRALKVDCYALEEEETEEGGDDE